ncbi:MAG: SBBP repeat-containing protein, partial [Candidatus Lokiarchaeota archaeon]|nr:SBBP repeat-containing protein [Candidatus Lokiarchaeota archaeon]
MKLGIQTVNKNRYLLMGFIVPLFLFGAIYASVTYSVDFLGGDVVTGAVLSRGSPIEDSGEVISFEPLPDPGGVPTIASIPAFSGFVQNCGQVADGNVSYYLQGKDQWIGFETGSIRFVTWGDNGTGMEALRLDFPNSNPVEPRGTRRMPHSTNYFISHEQYTDITSYAELNYDNIYPGIDLRFFHCAQGLKYEFIAAAGVDTSIIGLRFSPNAIVDAQPTRLVATSNRTGAVLYEEAGLNVYQTDGKSVGAAFDADDQLPGVVRFNLAPHAEDQGVVIDPIVLTFSTYVGGGAGDYGQSVAVDLSGFVYVAGYTTSVNFPTQNPYMTDPGDGTSDVFVMKMDPATPSLVYSTYLGGSSNDEAKAIAIDSAGNAYICGQSNSVNYPLSLLHHIQTYQVGYDVIVTKLNATGNGLVYSTYLGGTGNDMGYSIAVDQEAYAYVTGVTGSTSFPTQNPYMTDPGDGTDDGFVAKIDPSGDSLVYSTYLGGDGLDRLFDICVSPAGHAYVTGYTLSTNYPRLNELCLPAAGQEAVVTKLGPGGDTLEYSTYLGGASTDIAFAIAVDEAGSACITGRTESGDFPLSSPYQATSGGISDAFITKISAAGNTFVFSTYYGGNGYDVGRDVAFFPGGDVCVGIYGLSSNLPVVHQFQGDQAELDAYVVRLTGSGDRVVFATYLGGSSYEDYINLAIKDNDTVVVTGTTASTDFPLVNPYQGDQLETDVFVSALLFDLVPPSISLVSPSNGTTGRSIDMIHVTAADAHLATFRYTWVGVTGWLSIAADASISFCPVEGSHVLSLFANDTSGNSESMNFTFVTDDSGPAWNTAILPANNTWHTSNPVLALEFSDAAGMNNGWWDVDDATPDNILFSGASGTTWSHAGWYMDNLTWTTLSEGWHVLYFSAGDDLGNVGGAGGEWQWRFGKDTLVPASPTPASPTHPIGTWTDSNTIAVEWTVPGDSGGSGVVGYAISWSNNTPADPGTIVNTTMLTTDSPSLGSGMWYFNIRAIDGVGNFSAVASIGPFLIDVTPPSPVANLRSTSHTVDLWSNDRTIEVAWDEAVDSGGSGIAGYSFIWFPVPQTPPMSISTTITNHTSGELSDQASWFFNIIAIDFADNPSSLVSLGPFKIDGTPPTSPSPTSTTHVILNWSNSAVINMTWPVPSDMGGSGIAGYATSFSLGPSNPGTVITTTGTMTSSPSLASGNTWYFNIRSRDGAGSWSNVTNVGPFYIDANPPNTTISFVPTWPPYFVNVSTLFTLSGGDDPGGSGLDQREYSINGSEWAQGDSFTLFGWSNGTILIQYRSKDLVGNVEAFGTRVVRLDTLQPNTTISFVAEHSPDFVNASTPFTLGGADNTGGSGLLLREYRLDLGSWI